MTYTTVHKGVEYLKKVEELITEHDKNIEDYSLYIDFLGSGRANVYCIYTYKGKEKEIRKLIDSFDV